MPDFPGRAPNGAEDARRALHVIGYREKTDEHGNITLWARQSPLDIAPVPVVINAILCKKLAALYCSAEADEQMLRMGTHLLISDDGRGATAGLSMPGRAD